MCHQEQDLTPWHVRVLAIRWPNELCRRDAMQPAIPTIRRAESFGRDFVSRSVGSARPPPASDVGHLTCLNARWESTGRGVTGARPSHDTSCSSPPRGCGREKRPLPGDTAWRRRRPPGTRARRLPTPCAARPNNGQWQAMYYKNVWAQWQQIYCSCRVFSAAKNSVVDFVCLNGMSLSVNLLQCVSTSNNFSHELATFLWYILLYLQVV